jgi:hypothetical protein
VLAFGLPCVGKSHAMCAVGHALIDRGHAVRFMPTYSLVQEGALARREPGHLRPPLGRGRRTCSGRRYCKRGHVVTSRLPPTGRRGNRTWKLVPSDSVERTCTMPT